MDNLSKSKTERKMNGTLVSWGCHSHDHRLGGLKHRSPFSHSSGGQRSELGVSSGMLPLKAPGEDPSTLLHPLVAPGAPALVAASVQSLPHHRVAFSHLLSLLSWLLSGPL